MTQNQTQFGTTLSEMKGLAAVSRKTMTRSGSALEHITGGDEFCFVIPWRSYGPIAPPIIDWQLMVGNSGKVDLPNCGIRVVEIPDRGNRPKWLSGSSRATRC
jgi:hypothetical protein